MVGNNSGRTRKLLSPAHCLPRLLATVQDIFGFTIDANEFITSNQSIINGCESFPATSRTTPLT